MGGSARVSGDTSGPISGTVGVADKPMMNMGPPIGSGITPEARAEMVAARLAAAREGSGQRTPSTGVAGGISAAPNSIARNPYAPNKFTGRGK